MMRASGSLKTRHIKDFTDCSRPGFTATAETSMLMFPAPHSSLVHHGTKHILTNINLRINEIPNGFWQSKQGQTHVLWSGFPPVSWQAKKNKRRRENELIVWLLGTSSSLISVGEIAVKIRRSLQVKCWKANSRWMHWTRHRHYFVGNKGPCTMQDRINTLPRYCAAQKHRTIPNVLSSALH